jgi:hypothetical protein
VDEVGFWKAPNPVDDHPGMDGAQWIIEGVKGGKYHVVDRWMPKSGVTYNLGMLLAFGLSKLTVPRKEVY